MKEHTPEPFKPPPMMLCTELLYEVAPALDFHEIHNRIVASLSNAELVSKPEDSTCFLIAHPNHVFELQTGEKVPLLTGIIKGDAAEQSRLTTALQQTWDWPAARDLVPHAKQPVLVTEMMARVFEPSVRVSVFYEVLRRIVELVPPLCVHCQHAERIVDPARIIKASGRASEIDRMAAFLNVRLFRIENQRPGDMLMDTRGLAALGLPDLQIHFRNLEPGRVAAMLYNSAVYIYEKGDCVKDGNTIEGLSPGQRWRCQHEESLVGPKRLVIDIDPGDPFAAGKRHR